MYANFFESFLFSACLEDAGVWLRLHPRQVRLGNSRCMFFFVEGRHDMKGFVLVRPKKLNPRCECCSERSGVLAGLVTTGGVCCACRQVTTSVKLKKNMLESELVPEIVVFLKWKICFGKSAVIVSCSPRGLGFPTLRWICRGWTYHSINLLES